MIQKKYVPYGFLAPYLLLFSAFIIVPVAMAIALGFTNFNAISFPKFIGLLNYVNLFTQDLIFLQHVLPNSILFALIVGPGGYALAFLLAWSLAQIQKGPRAVLSMLIYSPSMTAGVAVSVVWRLIFLGSPQGYINAILKQLGLVNEPINFFFNAQFIMPIIILVAIWSSMGVGFLAMLAGVLNIDKTLYEAAAIDGMKSRLQEIFYITIPSMKPQMLFGAVMSIVGAFQAGAIGVMLTGSNPTPAYAGQLMVNHIEDYGFIRYEMGYASAASVVLLAIIWGFSQASRKVLKDD
ncbi:MAG: sugar ABC transporter permease [Clostridiales bacterium]|jgi:multiple sugar transport system permease protein|nr:sugar ABC transporter permease [Clostridiales bacterium]MDR2749041.1 sugar ABC transporter permease [Clostridiales bacterium]